ncbi:MAG: MBL fold metallo-hydrolase [Desulfobacterales bacterium]|nr:MBL fold metallo-hydrolase [Desulfobacterales bacterium]
MKLKFIGRGSAFTTPEYFQSNMILIARSGKMMLIDCGGDVRFSAKQSNVSIENIHAVYISHLHSDHIGGMEWIGFSTYFNPKLSKPLLFMEENHMQNIWEHGLKAGMEIVTDKLVTLSDYFECHPVKEGNSFEWEGIACTLIKMPHVVSEIKTHYSYGLLLREVDYSGATVFISTDTQFQYDEIINIGKKTNIIFHDCETSFFKTGVHAHYEDLCILPPEIKQKMWLYHYQPDPIHKPEQDGFRGFVQRGQEFDFSNSTYI